MNSLERGGSRHGGNGGEPMKIGKFIVVTFSILAMTLILMGLYELIVPYIPFGPVGFILVGVALLVVLAMLGVKRIPFS